MNATESTNIYVMPDGVKIYCDRPDRQHAHNAITDFYLEFSKYLDREMWAMDIGTSCGDSTVVMATCLGKFPNSRILAFEPSKQIYERLLHNLSQNNQVTYDLHTVAAGDENGLVDFVYGTDNGGILNPDILPERGNCPNPYKVQVVHTYEYLRANYSIDQLDKIGFIKIDTEGFDYIVLRGLAPLLYRNRIPVMVEWWNDPNNSNLMFDQIAKLYYQPYNSRGEMVNRFDFNTPKRTQDLILKPL